MSFGEGRGMKEQQKKVPDTFERVFASHGKREKFIGTNLEIKGKKYTVKKYLGGGFFANVWEARQGEEGVDVAMKISKPFDRKLQFISAEQGSDPERREKAESTRFFLREAAVLKKLGTGGESPYPKFIDALFVPHPTKKDVRMLLLIMEKIEGNSLEEMTCDEGLKEDSDEIIRVAAELAEGVAFTHDHGFVHRDITPANTMRAKDGRVRFLDLGLAIYRKPTSTKRVVFRQHDPEIDVGAYGFISQEEKDPFSPERDIFALGKTLDQILFGEAAVTDERRRQADARSLRDPRLIELSRLARRMGALNAQDRPKISEILQKIHALQSAK